MQRQRKIYGIILFLLAFSSSFALDIVLSPEISLDNILSSNYYSEDASTTIKYNVLTDTEEMEYFSNTYEEIAFQPIAPPYLGDTNYSSTLKEGSLEISYPFPPDDRVQITSTSVYPWSTICKLYITAADNSLFIGSGAMIDAYHVLTCGHCVYIHDHGGWVSQITVIPGMRGSYRPFGQALATDYRTYTGWIQDEMPEHDWAVLTLDRTIGNQTGWMGRRTADPSDPVYVGTLHTAGYPGDLQNGEYMYYDSDVGDRATQYNHWYWMDTSAGQSGGPVWVEDNGSYYILTVNAYEYQFGADANFGTRLNQDKYDQINIWIGVDTPPINPNGLDPNVIIFIVSIVAIGVVVLVIGIVVTLRKTKSKLTLVEPYQGNITRYDSEQELSLTQQLRSNTFGFCPNCGKQIFRDTQRYCSNCGYDMNLDLES